MFISIEHEPFLILITLIPIHYNFYMKDSQYYKLRENKIFNPVENNRFIIKFSMIQMHSECEMIMIFTVK